MGELLSVAAPAQRWMVGCQHVSYCHNAYAACIYKVRRLPSGQRHAVIRPIGPTLHLMLWAGVPSKGVGAGLLLFLFTALSIVAFASPF